MASIKSSELGSREITDAPFDRADQPMARASMAAPKDGDPMKGQGVRRGRGHDAHDQAGHAGLAHTPGSLSGDYERTPLRPQMGRMVDNNHELSRPRVAGDSFSRAAPGDEDPRMFYPPAGS
jgi:hypothetical protein